MADSSPPYPSPPLIYSPQPDEDAKKGLFVQDGRGKRLKARVRHIRQLLGDPHVWRPLVIAVGPLLTLCFVWTFFALTSTQPRAIPDRWAFWVRTHTQSATMVASIVATVLAAWTSFCFSLAIRYVIDLRLATRPTSLSELTCATKVAQKSLWLHSLCVGWTWVALISYVGISLQTSALTSFLSLREIRVRHEVSGSDIDISDPQTLRIAIQYGFLQVYLQTLSQLDNAMTHALDTKIGQSSSLNMNGFTYPNTTGGIQPASLVRVPTGDRMPLASPNFLDGISGDSVPLLFNKTMFSTQQGFTADVDCRVGDPQDQAKYLSIAFNDVPLGGTNFTMVSLNVTCPGGRTWQVDTFSEPAIASANGGTGIVLVAACQIPDTNSYDIIFRARNHADLDQTVCTISPKVTTVNVTYYSSALNFEVPTTVYVSQPISNIDDPGWGRLTVRMLLDIILSKQGVSGDLMQTVWLQFPSINSGLSLRNIMNTYFTAGVEFTGTVVRWICTQLENPQNLGLLDSEPTHTLIRGIAEATTYGWSQDYTISPLFLLPTTVIILATYGLLVYGVMLARMHKDDLQKEDADFDPTDIVHVIAARTPQLRTDNFVTFSDPSDGFIRTISVMLMSQEGKRVLCVKTKEARGSKGDLEWTRGARYSAVKRRDPQEEEETSLKEMGD